MSTVIIFPHQLFEKHPLLVEKTSVLLIEDSLFFGDKHYLLQFHKQKLLLHRASMKHYADRLVGLGHDVRYVEYSEKLSLKEVLDKYAEGEELGGLEPTDFILEKRLRQACQDLKLNLELSPAPNFLNTKSQNEELFANKKHWHMAHFYQSQRKRLNILVDAAGNPEGEKWSFDEENRKKLPKKLIPELPHLPTISEDKYLLEAKSYVKENFPNALGKLDSYYYPYDHKTAKAWLNNFLEERFANFGPYEDAIVEGQTWLYHSVLTPMLNIGLLTPTAVIEASLAYYKKTTDVPLASLEGFIRQIIGWREYMCAAYEAKGVEMRTSNYWQHNHAMPKAFYTATTGIPPIDDSIKRILETGYCHHIERLMVLGGFMFLCEIHPREIYKWFMELFIDSYDWVMVPNVYAMSQNSAGGLITTKPYFSGSNYIRKMSHYPKGDWCDVWDGLYWQFIVKHQTALAKNHRWAMMVRMAQKLDEDKKARIFGAADDFRTLHFAK